MKTIFRESFWRDVRKIRDKKAVERIEEVIAAVEKASRFSEVRNVKKMAGAATAYRIRVGGFRIGIYVAEDTVEFARCLDRKDMYGKFPES